MRKIGVLENNSDQQEKQCATEVKASTCPMFDTQRMRGYLSSARHGAYCIINLCADSNAMLCSFFGDFHHTLLFFDKHCNWLMVSRAAQCHTMIIPGPVAVRCASVCTRGESINVLHQSFADSCALETPHVHVSCETLIIPPVKRELRTLMDARSPLKKCICHRVDSLVDENAISTPIVMSIVASVV